MSGDQSIKKQPYLQQYLQCEAAAAAVEFAIVLPLLLLLVFGIVEFCLVLYEGAVLEGALTVAARVGKTGAPDIADLGVKNGPRWNLVLATLKQQTTGLLDSSQIGFNAIAYPEYGNVGQAVYVPNSIGQKNQVVLYTVTYPYPSSPLLSIFLGKDPHITQTVMVQNEPFTLAPVVDQKTQSDNPPPHNPPPNPPPDTPPHDGGGGKNNGGGGPTTPPTPPSLPPCAPLC